MKVSFSQVPKIVVMTAGLSFLALPALAQPYPPPYPRPNATVVLQNDRVNIWDVYWLKGQPTPLHTHVIDQFSITLEGGSIRVTRPPSPPGEPHESKFGSVTFVPKGTTHIEEGMSDVPQHKMMLEVKPSPANAGVHGTSPGEGAIKVFENDRLVAWDLTWKPGELVSRPVEDLDSVTVFLEGGTIRSEGSSPNTTSRSAGAVIYSPRGSTAHNEEAVTGSPRAIIVELK
jgi:quercetin dioxygenase-like cupin family protein